MRQKHSSGGDTRRPHQRYGDRKNTLPKQPKFERKCEKLKGHIYACSDIKQSDIFTKTTREIAEYVGRSFMYGSDVRLAIENLAVPILYMPSEPTTTASKTDVRIWEKKVDAFVKRETYLAENLKTVYSLVWGKCTDIARQKLEGVESFKAISNSGDILTLLKTIKDMVYNFQSQKYLPHVILESIRRFYLCTQGRHKTAQAYLEQHQNNVDIVLHSGGTLGIMPGMVQAIFKGNGGVMENLNEEEKIEIERTAQKRYLAMAYLFVADRNIYGKLIENLENYFL